MLVHAPPVGQKGIGNVRMRVGLAAKLLLVVMVVVVVVDKMHFDVRKRSSAQPLHSPGADKGYYTFRCFTDRQDRDLVAITFGTEVRIASLLKLIEPQPSNKLHQAPC